MSEHAGSEPVADAPAVDDVVAEDTAQETSVSEGAPSDATPIDADAGDEDGAASEEPAVPDDARDRDELILAALAAEADRDDHLDQLRRLQAEFDNYRKRSAREAVTQRDAGVADLAGKLLDVLDDFDMALLSVDKTEDIAALHKGLELVYTKFISTLRGVGLERIDEAGATFDPERHDAVQQVEADEPTDEPVVADVLRAGYALKGRVLRPAMVKVAQ